MWIIPLNIDFLNHLCFNLIMFFHNEGIPILGIEEKIKFGQCSLKGGQNE